MLQGPARTVEFLPVLQHGKIRIILTFGRFF